MAKKKINHEAVSSAEELVKLFKAMNTEIAALRTAVNELRTDHATFKASVDEIETWAETLAAKLNADGGVTDTNYDATITNSAPATLAAAAVTEQVESPK